MTDLSNPVVAILERTTTLLIVDQLCRALEDSDVDYCHWKSNIDLGGSLVGENDLDLLIRRRDIRSFVEILHRLGFKQANGSSEIRIPGVESFFGYDQETGKLVHVHAHYQLVLGHDMTKNYRLPIEDPFLDASIYDEPMVKASPRFEFVVYVIRMVLKHSTWDAILARQGTLSEREQKELNYLRALTNSTSTSEILRQHLPFVDGALFDDCVRSLMPDQRAWPRMKAGQRLRRALMPYARSSQFREVYLRLLRRGQRAVRRRMAGRMPKNQLVSGGAIIAIIGGDGAGKSTIVDNLHAWLSSEFDVTKVHLGKPRWSLTTIVVRSILKIGRILGFYPYARAPIHQTSGPVSSVFPGYPWLLREVCTARDRNHTYVKARKFANNGGIVVSDRYPLPQIKFMDGHRSDLMVNVDRSNRLVDILVRADEQYYQQIASPELIILLRVDPEIAVERKIEENAASVRARSKEMWKLDWNETPVHVIDAGQSPAEVLAHAKAFIWTQL